MKSSNTVWHQGQITQKDREKQLRQKAVLIWFTGLSGSGKSTIAYALEHKLYQLGNHCYVLDGDNIRHGLNGNLGFSQEDRKENIRRIGEVAKLFLDAGLITLSAFISPFRAYRNAIRQKLEKDQFIEIFVKCSLKECEKRDVKGLYKKARSNEITDFTGISSPYEEPENPELIIESDKLTVEESVEKIIGYLMNRKIITKPPASPFTGGK
ncbi:MAG: adenylyl-sulfate kinase [Candidatus Cloacimonetes bacterium]|nr:adenylyl-sulfate kinase [Candidatus Cloacimonadota bacterium]